MEKLMGCKVIEKLDTLVVRDSASTSYRGAKGED